ncbi:MAG: hypothetical protein CM15mP120_25650 [Pseudomonadota bacterium]|nr:MAG: hypothetical protein CM15mP120_25650 [Pseudomonadota bacterium]
MNRAITASGNVDRQIALASAITVLRGRLDAKAPHIAVSVTATAEPEDRAVVFVVARPPVVACLMRSDAPRPCCPLMCSWMIW